MKILLIDPPFKAFTGFVNFYFPIGLTSLAAVLNKAGHETKVFDADSSKKGSDLDFSDEYGRLELYRRGLNDDAHESWRHIKRVLAEFNPDMVGITAMTTKFGSVLKTASLVKEYDRSCKVVAGGPHPTLLPEQALNSGDIDMVVRGEGEVSFLNLVNCITAAGDLGLVKGVSFKGKGGIAHNPDEAMVEDLNVIPFPDRTTLMEGENYTAEDMGVIMASRGCPFNCSYCCHPWGRRVRHRSTASVIEEIVEVKDRYKTTQFEFKDDTFTVNRSWVKELCDKLLAGDISISWGCTTRVDVLDEELIGAMKKAGCNVIKIGVETGSERILKKTCKGIDLGQIKEAARMLNKHGIFWSGYFMIGLPDETEADIKKTCSFMEELNPPYAGLGVYNPFPKTELFYSGVKAGLLSEDVELKHFFDTNPKDYFFVDPGRRVLNIEKERFNRLAADASREFHRHNTKVINMLRRGWSRRLAYARSPVLLANDLKKALGWWL